MSIKVEFFYDYVSVYSYLANSQIASLGANVVYRPMLIGAVMQATGNLPPATVEAKGNYMRRDVDRWCDHYGIAFNFNPEFPQNTVNALRIALVAQSRGEFDVVHQRLFDAMWVQQMNLGDPEVLASIVADAGLPAKDYIAAIADQGVKDVLRANTDEAISRGAFGAPNIFVGDEMFFGNDRMDFVKAAIERQAET
jgi:2-hydroxychromene-2-carboxylate isomerase